MKISKILMTLSLILFAANSFCQTLPPSYQPMFNEIVQNFKTITSGNSISQGDKKLSVINDDKIAFRIVFKKKVKNLTFITSHDEENKVIWIAANDLTIDMVNKYEDDLTKMLESMLKLSEKKSKE